jgi:hypothetical protein
MRTAGVMQWTVWLEARTSDGGVTTTEVTTFSRPVVDSTFADVGLVLSETKALSAKLQTSMLCDQMAEYAAHRRICVHCGVPQPLKKRRTRRLQTLFGTVEIAAPRFKLCRCRRSVPMEKVALFSPICELLTGRCTPELERVQAELGARTSFRDVVRILDLLLPGAPATHESVRNRTHVVALRIEAADRQAPSVAVPEEAPKLNANAPIVLLDGAYIRAAPGQPVRKFEAICGKVEQEGCSSRRFGFVRSVAEPADALLRAALHEQGWREGEAVVAISDGDPALPALVHSATGGPVKHSLDWFHLSMRLHHVEQVMSGLAALEPPPRVPLDSVQVEVERLRHCLWNGDHEKAIKTLGRIVSWAEMADAASDTAMVTAKVERLVARCTELRAYIENNTKALIDYGQRYRAGKPVSSSRAESTVNQLVNARMNKRRQMRWSPQGAHRVLQVRAAVLDNRLAQQTVQLAA